MQIRKSSKSDKNTILKIYEYAREFMKNNGNPSQWGNHYPQPELIEEDIKNGTSYVCMDEDEIVGTFCFMEGEDPTYKTIYQGEWLNNEPYSVVHRVASFKEKRGIATFCLDWCFEQCKNIRIDTHRENIPMQTLLKNKGFVPCGVIYLENGEDRIAFQKIE